MPSLKQEILYSHKQKQREGGGGEFCFGIGNWI